MLSAPPIQPRVRPVLRRLPERKLAAMTLCIAAIAGDGKGIVTASDLRFDLGHTSGDGRPKFGRIHSRWAAMFAGADVSNAPTILENITEALQPFQEVRRADVERLFVEECRAALIRDIEAVVLSPFNRMTMKAFTESGVKRFTEQVYAQLFSEISGVKLQVEFIVFGFDKDLNPHIFRVHDRGVVVDRKVTGFAAIGSGDVAAEHYMMFHEYKTRLPLRTATYYVCAAKFFAERASLGEATHVVCLMNDGRLLTTDEKAIRTIWEGDGKPKIPDGVWDRLPAFTDIEGGVKPSDQVVRLEPVVPSSSVKVGDWISAALQSGNIGFNSGPVTPLVLDQSTKQAKKPTLKRPKRGRKGRPPSQE